MRGSVPEDSSSGRNGAPTSSSVRWTVGEFEDEEDVLLGGGGGGVEGAEGAGGAAGGARGSAIELEDVDDDAGDVWAGGTHVPGMTPSSREEQTNGGTQSLGE
ncbi:hypothetical protein COU80_00465 [Candidatus Peregrinibacteria bacterium CG10_big_fil_rev_8_21_14_0_10_55_24]|nr:MAG: hypothetical protein COU80_00465 [Candidatus Peregrinibacteria bacterium CG10_big_fil_rev_8_21_14_0_10_55_24]